MLAGWKKNPHWRLYYEARKAHRIHVIRERREMQQQMEALDAAATEILAAEEVRIQKTNPTRH